MPGGAEGRAAVCGRLRSVQIGLKRLVVDGPKPQKHMRDANESSMVVPNTSDIVGSSHLAVSVVHSSRQSC